jgi:hypothetical protein
MATNLTPTDPDALLSLVQRIKENYQEPPPPPPKRGQKRDFTALSFLLLAAVAVTFIAIEALLAGELKVTDALLGDETFGGGLFPYLYEEAGGWVLSPKQLPQERRSWKDDLYDYRKETVELLFQRIIQALGLKECQVKGEGRNGAFVLASVWLYQICYLTNYCEGKPLACIKDHLDCARWRIPSG